MRKLCEVLLKRLLTFEETVILFLESLRNCCVLCESRKLTKITSSSSSSSLGILRPPRSGALALPHNVDVNY